MTDRLHFVFDRTDRTHASLVPVAVAFDDTTAQKEVERLQTGLSDQAKTLIYARPASQTSIQVLSSKD